MKKGRSTTENVSKSRVGAALYLRVSTEEQARDGVSLSVQEERLTAYCKLANLKIVAIISDEGVSGSKPISTRLGGQKLQKLVSSQQITNIVALKLDRLFRDAENALHMTRAWEKAGIDLHLVDQNGEVLSTRGAYGRMLLTIMAAFAELERNMISDRTEAALAHKKARKEVYSPIPYGFNRVGDSLVENPKELRIIALIQGWRERGWTLGRIAAELGALQVPTKNCRTWHGSTIRQILANDLYRLIARDSQLPVMTCGSPTREGFTVACN